MRIILLGHTGVGKSTYMASLYGAFQTPIMGFHLQAHNRFQHEQLLKHYRHICAGTYPNILPHCRHYDFSLLFEGEAVLPFEWIENSKCTQLTAGQEEAERLLAELGEADGFVLFYDANLAADKNIQSSISKMTNLVIEVLRKKETPTMVSLVFSKSDLVERIDTELLHQVNTLILAIANSKRHVGTLLPLACGREMINPTMPVLFTIHFGVLFQILRLTNEIERWRQVEEASSERNEKARWKELSEQMRSWLSLPTTRAHARLALEQAEARKLALEKLGQPVRQLSTYLRDMPFVFGAFPQPSTLTLHQE